MKTNTKKYEDIPNNIEVPFEENLGEWIKSLQNVYRTVLMSHEECLISIEYFGEDHYVEQNVVITGVKDKTEEDIKQEQNKVLEFNEQRKRQDIQYMEQLAGKYKKKIVDIE